jgi:hypothetical protein
VGNGGGNRAGSEGQIEKPQAKSAVVGNTLQKLIKKEQEPMTQEKRPTQRKFRVWLSKGRTQDQRR